MKHSTTLCNNLDIDGSVNAATFQVIEQNSSNPSVIKNIDKTFCEHQDGRSVCVFSDDFNQCNYRNTLPDKISTPVFILFIQN